MSIYSTLETLGITLPPATKPVASYISVKQTGNLLYLAGQLPMQDGQLLHPGKLGKEISTEEGNQAAKQCAINALAAIHSHTPLDNVASIVKLMVFVNSTDSYIDSPLVANGASDLFVEVFGQEIGQHTRSAVSVASLPKGAPVELDLVVELKEA